jgi:hypothetical protein
MNWPPLLLIFALYTLNPITISVYPAFAMQPATFRITVMVPRHFENRHLCYGVTGPEDKKSCLSLDSWQSRRTWTVYWSLRTAGEYEAIATVTRRDAGRERSYIARQPFRVIGGMEP